MIEWIFALTVIATDPVGGEMKAEVSLNGIANKADCEDIGKHADKVAAKTYVKVEWTCEGHLLSAPPLPKGIIPQLPPDA